MSPQVWRAQFVLSITQIATWGSLFYAIALLGPRIEAETGWPDAIVYGGFACGLLAAGLAAPFVGQAIDRHGGRPILAIGSVVAGAGLALVAVARSEWTYVLAWIVAGASMAATLYDPAFAMLARLAGSRTRTAISLLTLAGGFASTVSWPLTFELLKSWDWRSVALLYAGFQAFACAPLHWFVLPDDRVPVPIPPAGHQAEARRIEAPPLSDRRARAAALAWFALVVTSHSFVTSALSVHLVRLLDLLGMTEGQAVLAGAFIGPAQVAARLLELLFGRRLDATGLGLVATVLLPISFAILLGMAVTPATAVVFALLYGASNGLITIARGVVPFALFGPERYGETLGRISAPALVTKAAAPVLFTVILAWLGGPGTLVLCAALGLVAVAAMAALARLRRLNRPAPA